MRIGGLASGIDTESIIKDMMNAKRIPLTKITQKKQTLEWQLDSYRAVNRKLKDFSEKAFNNMILSDSFKAKKMENSSPNDVSITSKTATSDFAGTIGIQKLAKSATMQSDVIAAGAGTSSDTTLDSLGISGTTITISAIDENGAMQNKTVTVDPLKDTLTTLMSKITKETGVNAFYDTGTGKIAMSTKHGGSNGNEIVVTGGDIADKLKLTGRPVTTGSRAEYTVNGLQMSSSKNVVDVNGFEFTLKAETTSDVTFSSKPDTDAIVESVSKFIDDYNKLMDELNGLTREKTHRDFKPLSAEEKSAMSDKEIELWEEKAKSGLLKNDSILSATVTKMRSALMGSVKDQGSLKDIGIATPGGQFAWQANGKLEINVEKLKAAIEEDPDKIHKMFSQSFGGKNVPVEEQGFAVRLRGIVQSAEQSIKERAGEAKSTNASFTLGRNLDAMNKQMDMFQTRLKLVENRLWKQFSAMETAINRANAQSANLASALGGGA